MLDLLALAALDEHGLMRTLDAEVAADVEAAARLLARQLQRRRQGCAQHLSTHILGQLPEKRSLLL